VFLDGLLEKKTRFTFVDGTEDGALRREIRDEPLELPASLKAIETLAGRRRRRRRGGEGEEGDR